MEVWYPTSCHLEHATIEHLCLTWCIGDLPATHRRITWVFLLLFTWGHSTLGARGNTLIRLLNSAEIYGFWQICILRFRSATCLVKPLTNTNVYILSCFWFHFKMVKWNAVFTALLFSSQHVTHCFISYLLFLTQRGAVTMTILTVPWYRTHSNGSKKVGVVAIAAVVAVIVVGG